ncbi:hypothetical protein FRB93_003387 [Tulasnella sp. JGI-2019a]|nr:hypothetical protein FRB93_003387 [Tulasnella sp. JGI-2019a]
MLTPATHVGGKTQSRSSCTDFQNSAFGWSPVAICDVLCYTADTVISLRVHLAAPDRSLGSSRMGRDRSQHVQLRRDCGLPQIALDIAPFSHCHSPQDVK